MPLYLREKLKDPRVKKTIGIILIIVGLLALFTPLTPGSWLIPIGLELIGIDLLFYKKIKEWLKKKFGKTEETENLP
ncbi:MAG: PGPGW domain-containing protein [Candidatus Pacebacteria bacterium]|nr:PGPGW domain-containing protein [Candidatus Paceibacterota bacterium]MDD5357362.1 PGPGW domain-containing protein [Candidatus Paceibacterota bacterium]